MGLLDITPVTLKDMDNAAARIHADLSTVQEGLRQLFCREDEAALRARVAELEAALRDVLAHGDCACYQDDTCPFVVAAKALKGGTMDKGKEKTKCAHCGKETTVMTFSIRGRDETAPICSKCFDKRTKQIIKNLKGGK